MISRNKYAKRNNRETKTEETMLAKTKIPTKITVHTVSKTVEIMYDKPEHDKPVNAQPFVLTGEYLRVHSPSAEVRRHGKPELQTGKKDVGVSDAILVGLYGVKFVFDDGHDTGIYTWEFLHDLCTAQDEYWNSYLAAMHAAGQSREKDTSIVKLFTKK